MNNTPTQSTELMSSTPLRQVKSVKELLFNAQAKEQLAMVAAKHLDPARMMRVVANAIRTTPKLGACEPMSFLGALMHCASLGLEPNTPLGHAYLIPFENKRKNVTEVQVVIGYKGFLDLARRTGQLAHMHGDVVYSDDVFSHEYGSNHHLRHVPGPRKGKVLGFYCYLELKIDADTVAKGHRFMSYDEVIAHRNAHSQGWKTAVRFNKTADSPWNEKGPGFEAMGIKTVIRRMAGRGELPMSIDFMNAMDTDEAHVDYRGLVNDFDAGPQIEDQSQDEDQAAIEGSASTVKEEAKEETKTAPAKEQVNEKPKQESDPQKDAPATAEDPKPTAEERAAANVTANKEAAEAAERRANLINTIMSDLREGGQGQTRSVLDMYSDQLDVIAIEEPEEMERINKLAYAIEKGEA